MNLLVHTLEVWHPTFDETDVDERGHPAVDYAQIATVAGLVQPKTVREVQLLSQAGAEVGDYTIHLLPMALDERDRIDRVISGGRESYEITGIRRFDFGRLAHFEVDARRYSADAAQPEEEEGS